MAIVNSEHIDIDPAVCHGRPRIRGTRIRVQDIVVEHLYHGLCAEEIVGEFPHLTLGDVYAALAYYYDHLDEIRQTMRNDHEFVERMRAEAPSLLRRKAF